MTHDDISALFILAAAHKADGDFEKVDEVFLATVGQGIPEGVQVVYLFDRVPPTSLDEASDYDVFVLEFEEQEGQVIPVPLLKRLDELLVVFLFATAEFRPIVREKIDWDQIWSQDEGAMAMDPSPLADPEE